MQLHSQDVQLSIVVATYNRKDSLLRLLRSLAHQSLDPRRFEVIVVNDGSDDGTYQALEGLKVPYLLHVIYQPNQGQAAARQNGALKATREVLLFLDDDMDTCAELLVEHVKEHEKAKKAVVLGHIKAPPPSFPRPNFVWYEEQFLARLYENIQRKAVEPCWEHFYTGNVSMSREFFWEAGGFDLTMQRSEDIELGYRLNERKINFYFAPRAETIHYSDHRSFPSWLKTAYQDGAFRVRMFNKLNALPTSHPVMAYYHRHPLSRLMLQISIGSDGVRKWLSEVLRICGDTLSFLHLKRLCYYAYSAIHTINYFAGIRDEMGGLTEFSRRLKTGFDKQTPRKTGPYTAKPLSTNRVGASSESDRRVLSVDALRGMFLLIMTLGFTIEPKIFPPWMYHRQFPPPEHTFVKIPGITWRDLAYPAFLFIMAAALPITLSRKIERGMQASGLLLATVKRGALLFMFALMIGHADSSMIGEYTTRARVLGIVGFAIMFMIFTQRRPDWAARKFDIVRAAGWLLAIAFLMFSPLVYEQRFSLARSDQIIEDLAFAMVAGSVLWYFTRTNVQARLIALALFLSAFLRAQEPGLISAILSSVSVDWLFDHFDLLAVVIPGTIAGDLLLRLIRLSEPDKKSAAWSPGRLQLLAALGVMLTPILVVGLYNRWVGETTILVLALLAVELLLVYRPATPTDQIVRQFVLWASLWLTLGVLLEPFQGGIEKIPSTLSYFFTMSGNTFFLLAALVIVVDLLGYRKWMSAFIKIGQNPMICYVLFIVFLDSALDLIPPIEPMLHGGSPLEAMVRSFVTVLIVALLVLIFTKKRIFWRT